MALVEDEHDPTAALGLLGLEHSWAWAISGAV